MALYQEATSILQACHLKKGSLKSEVYSNKISYKSKPVALYALISETSKWDIILKEVIDNTKLLSQEPKVILNTPS